jgi:tRNA N6-adenosine threonylcarbamoyltransferase
VEVVVAGGVAANTLLRKRAAEVVGGRARLTMPPLDLCTDNAAMIASAAHFAVQAGGLQPATVDPSLGW